MNKSIHIAAGIITGVVLSNNLELDSLESLLCVSTTILGSLLPDIDTPYSYIGNRVKLISIPIYKLFGHRTVTHSLLVWTVLLLASPIFYQGLIYGILCISLYGGIVSHLILDTISPIGVPLLYPVHNVKVHLLPHRRRKNKRIPRRRKRLPI